MSLLFWLGLAIRLLVGGVLGVGGVAKFAMPSDSRQRWLESYQLFPARTLRVAATVIPVSEVTVSAALISGSFGWISEAAGAGLIGVFTVAIGLTLVRGPRPQCGCFGRLSDEVVSPPVLARNAVLVGLLLLAIWLTPQGPNSPAVTLPIAIGLMALLAGAAMFLSGRHAIKEGIVG